MNNFDAIVNTMTKQDLYKEILQDLSLIATKDKTEIELIAKAKDSIEQAMAIDLLSAHMLKII